MTECEHAKEASPCSAFRSHSTAVKWVLSVLTVVGGVGIGFALSQSNEAKAEAMQAKETASNVKILENEISHVRDDIREVKAALGSIREMEIGMAELGGDVRLMLEKMKQLERAE